jgi:tRNA-splicing ligase RtcB
MKGADSTKVSDKAIKRGFNQLGTLGSGNHYLEIQRVKEKNFFDKEIAKKLGFFDDQIVIMFHCGSRGFGHQIGTDYLQEFLKVMEPKYKINISDKELACAPFKSKEGQDYFGAMKCAVNMAFANRQVILHRIREVFSKTFGNDAENLGLNMTYDVAHNIAKLEKYKVDGKVKELLVHRKGATRSFGPGIEGIPKEHKEIGQVVIIGGSMETGSYILTGTDKAMEKTFGSTAHGAGRLMSRTKAKQMFDGSKLQKDLEEKGIYVKGASMKGLAEEAGEAYKDIHSICETLELAGISKRIVSLEPIGNIKG